jgi:hypothetical protein
MITLATSMQPVARVRRPGRREEDVAVRFSPRSSCAITVAKKLTARAVARGNGDEQVRFRARNGVTVMPAAETTR